MTKTVHILLVCLAYLALAGCGTKGPLYIPEQRYPQGVQNNTAPKNIAKHALQANNHKPFKPALFITLAA